MNGQGIVNQLNDHLGGISGVRTQTLHLNEPFLDMTARFAHAPGSVVLLSGGDLDCSRYHLLAIQPWLTLTGRRGQTSLAVDGTTHLIPQAPLDVLQRVLEDCRLTMGDDVAPIAAGLFGYLAYDLKDSLESLPRTSIDDLDLPHLFLVSPSLIVVHDKTTATTTLHAPVRGNHGSGAAQATIDAFLQTLTLPAQASGDFKATGPSLKSNVTRVDHVTAVKRIIDYIAAGDVYQVNLSQRFEMGFVGDGYSLFKTLFRLNPAPFFAYVNAGDHQIVSTSPERFLLRHGNRIETRPIKGTRPRGETPEQDREMKTELAGSAKDDAELSMIVDLLRNDIGKVCAKGSVIVTQHKRLETYQNVYHLVSVVEGRLAEGKNSVDLIRATFPGGSITGCPKIRSMEVIDELESHRRHVYTGSIGYISFHNTMDLSIAIRTATIVDDRLVFSVGGGIVYDSDPEDEYEETLHKGRTLMSVFQGTGEKAVTDGNPAPWVWQNGRLIPLDQAVVPVADLGVQYGFGFFETIRVDKGVAHRLHSHMDRFNGSWAALFGTEPPDLTWKDIIAQVIERNALSQKTAAVKILASRGDGGNTRFNGTVLVIARPYTHRLKALGARGLRLATYPYPRMTPLAEHKSLNYLYYYQAGTWAREQGADEALILNPDKSVSETNTASILVVAGKEVIRPQSTHVLAGTMQKAVCRRLKGLDYHVIDRVVRPGILFDADTVILTNALMGAVPALSLNGRYLKSDADLMESINHGLFDAKEAEHAL